MASVAQFERSAVNPKGWWLKPTRGRFSFYSAHTFTHLSTRSLFRKLWLFEYHRQEKDKLLKNQGPRQYIPPLYMTIPGKTDYLLKFHLSQDIITCTHGGSRTQNLWIRSPTR